MKKKDPYVELKWIARISGILLVVFTLFMVIGELLGGESGPEGNSLSPLIVTIFIIWGIALAGLILAIWQEKPGGIISIIAFMLAFILNLFNKEAEMHAETLGIFLLFSIPAILHLTHWKLSKDKLSKKQVQKPEGTS